MRFSTRGRRVGVLFTVIRYLTLFFTLSFFFNTSLYACCPTCKEIIKEKVKIIDKATKELVDYEIEKLDQITEVFKQVESDVKKRTGSSFSGSEYQNKLDSFHDEQNYKSLYDANFKVDYALNFLGYEEYDNLVHDISLYKLRYGFSEVYFRSEIKKNKESNILFDFNSEKEIAQRFLKINNNYTKR